MIQSQLQQQDIAHGKICDPIVPTGGVSTPVRSLEGVFRQLRLLFPYERNELITFLLASLALALPSFSSSVPVRVHHHHKPKHHKHVDKRIGIVKPWNSKLDRMAYCESTNRWYLDTGNGFYGGLQFTLQTWWSVGGRGHPNYNSVLEQKYRAVLVHNRAGSWTRDWPVCGYR